MANAGKWHTKLEKDIIIKLGGTPLKKKGYDGMLNGKAVEVRATKADKQPRFKIDKPQHDEMMKLKGNYIIFTFFNTFGSTIPHPIISSQPVPLVIL